MDILTGRVYVSDSTEFTEVKVTKLEGKGVWFVPRQGYGWGEIPTWEFARTFERYYRPKPTATIHQLVSPPKRHSRIKAYISRLFKQR